MVSSTRRLNDRIGERFPGEERSQVGDSTHSHLSARLHRSAADMREHDHVVECQQLRFHTWLVHEHVKAGPAELSASKRSKQGVLINQVASRRVDEEGDG
jgi:hypothetical protein